jgi:transposase
MMRALTREVYDTVFEAIEHLLPEPPSHPLGCHRPRIPDRVCFRGLLYRLVTGASWETVEFLLDYQVSDTTLRARRNEWIDAGVFDAIAAQARAAYDRVIGLDANDVIIDGSDHLAPCGGEGTGVGPGQRGRKGFKWCAGTDGDGIPLAWTLDGANRNDYRMLNNTLDAVVANLPLQRIGTLHLDRGFGYKSLPDKLAGYPIDDVDVIPRRQPHQGRIPLVGFGKRWIAERTHSWLCNYGQLRRNTDRRSEHRHAAICLATALLITAKLLDFSNHSYRPIR